MEDSVLERFGGWLHPGTGLGTGLPFATKGLTETESVFAHTIHVASSDYKSVNDRILRRYGIIPRLLIMPPLGLRPRVA